MMPVQSTHAQLPSRVADPRSRVEWLSYARVNWTGHLILLIYFQGSLILKTHLLT